MKIGILAHSHDRRESIERAFELFAHEGVEMVIHAGDFCAPFTIARLKATKRAWIGVFGRNDAQRLELAQAAEHRIQDAPYVLNLGGCRVAVVHDPEDQLIDGESLGQVGLLIVGAPYEPSVEQREGFTRICPGDASGYVSTAATVAIFDTENSQARIVPL